MITHYLGDAEVEAYARDLVARLEARGENFPATWFAMGMSGQKIARTLGRLIGERSIGIVRVACDRDTKAVTLIDEYDANPEDAVLVLDSAIHSGSSMLAVVKKLQSIGIRDITTYSLVAKIGSVFVPNYFGLLIGDKDRAYFQLSTIPNNRLKDKEPFGVLRMLSHADATRTFPKTGVFDYLSFGDYIYGSKTQGFQVYLYDYGDETAGFVSFVKKENGLLLDAIASSLTHRNKGVGALLIRWAETWARHSGCEFIDLWAIHDQVDFYEKFKYLRQGPEMDLGAGEKYFLMRKPVLYNTKINGSSMPDEVYAS